MVVAFIRVINKLSYGKAEIIISRENNVGEIKPIQYNVSTEFIQSMDLLDLIKAVINRYGDGKSTEIFIEVKNINDKAYMDNKVFSRLVEDGYNAHVLPIVSDVDCINSFFFT